MKVKKGKWLEIYCPFILSGRERKLAIKCLLNFLIRDKTIKILF